MAAATMSSYAGDRWHSSSNFYLLESKTNALLAKSPMSEQVSVSLGPLHQGRLRVTVTEFDLVADRSFEIGFFETILPVGTLDSRAKALVVRIHAYLRRRDRVDVVGRG